jgi:hypothetical protein
MRILFIGDKKENVLDRANALTRLGHEVVHIDPFNKPLKRYFAAVGYRVTGVSIEWIYLARIKKEIRGVEAFDFVFLNQCPYLGRSTYTWLKSYVGPICNYVVDDPFGNRNHPWWKLFMGAIDLCDHLVVVRDSHVSEASECGVKSIQRTYLSYEDTRHLPIPMNPDELKKYKTDVAFIGTCLQGRGEFMSELIQKGVPVRVYGQNWEKSDKYQKIKENLIPGGVYGDEYVKAIQGASICIGMLSKENRNTHTNRSVEIPAIGSVLCAERTKDHLYMFEEDKEAIFWADADECASKILNLLKDKERVRELSKAGHRRVTEGKFKNIDIMEGIVNHLQNLVTS